MIKERNPFYVLINEQQGEQKKWDYKFKEVPLAYHALCYNFGLEKNLFRQTTILDMKGLMPILMINYIKNYRINYA